MTYQEALRKFKSKNQSFINLQEAQYTWGNYIYDLLKNDEITKYQFEGWESPFKIK